MLDQNYDIVSPMDGKAFDGNYAAVIFGPLIFFGILLVIAFS